MYHFKSNFYFPTTFFIVWKSSLNFWHRCKITPLIIKRNDEGRNLTARRIVENENLIAEELIGVLMRMNRKFGGGRAPTGTPSLAWSCAVVVVSLLAGASVVHNIYKPNLVRSGHCFSTLVGSWPQGVWRNAQTKFCSFPFTLNSLFLKIVRDKKKKRWGGHKCSLKEYGTFCQCF